MAKRKFPVAYLALWIALIMILGGYYLLFAPRDSAYSEDENRMLAGFPEVTWDSVFSGTFGREMETYLLDRFPIRSTAVSLSAKLESSLSLASHDDYLQIAEGPEDLLDTGDYEEDLDDLLDSFTTPPTQPVQVTEPEQTEPDPTASTTEATEPEETKPPMTIDDFPATLGVYMDRGSGEARLQTYSRSNVAAVTAVLNKYAQLLPKGGKLLFTVVPQSGVGTRYVNAANRVSFYATWDEVVNGLGANNVHAFDTAEILAQAILDDQYVYFRTDMHWTPLGSYLVYSEMVEKAGKTPCSYTDDFTITVEEPFRGTYYRDNPGAYGGVKADTLELLMPNAPLEWRRITGVDEYKVIDFLNFNAKKNDRYTVYLGGPAGPWTYAESDNGQTENCLVLTDSFGLGFIPFLTANYKQVHYYDTRYFNQQTVGYSVAQMISKYDITDIYVVVGDLHSFDSPFLLTNANKQLHG